MQFRIRDLLGNNIYLLFVYYKLYCWYKKGPSMNFKQFKQRWE